MPTNVVMFQQTLTTLTVSDLKTVAMPHKSIKVPRFHVQMAVTKEDTGLYINKIQRDAKVCRCLFTAKLLYMFLVSIAPIIRSTSNCNCSFWYRS